jgi:hypothetical protein
MTFSKEGNFVLLSVILVIALLVNVIVQLHLKVLYQSSTMTFIIMALNIIIFSSSLFVGVATFSRMTLSRIANEIILFDTWLKSCAWGKHFSLFCHHQDTQFDDTHHTYKKVKKCLAEHQN